MKFLPSTTKKLLVALLLFTYILVSDSHALFRKGQLGLTGSVVSGFPSGKFSDLTNTGLGVGLESEYYVTQNLALGFLFNYLPFQGPDIIQATTLSEEWYTLNYGLTAKWQFDPAKELVPYFKLAASATNFKADVSRQYEDPADTTDSPIDTTLNGYGRLTLSGGVGLRWDIEPWFGLSGELLFTQFFGVVHEIRQIQFGELVVTRRDIDPQYVSFNLNATFFFGSSKKK